MTEYQPTERDGILLDYQPSEQDKVLLDYAQTAQRRASYQMSNEELAAAIEWAFAAKMRTCSVDDDRRKLVIQHFGKLLEIQAARARAVCVDSAL